MKREGFRINRRKKMSKRSVCNFFGDRGMPVSPSEITYHAVGTFSSRGWDYDRCTYDDTIETVDALAVIIKGKPRGLWQHSDTDDGLVEIYSLENIYGECIGEVPAPRGAKR